MEDEECEIRVVVLVKDRELIVCGEWSYKWEEGIKRRRHRGRVSYNPPEQTWHVSTLAQLSRSLLRLSIPSIRLGTCMLTGSHSDARSSQSHISLLLLLNQMTELGSSNNGLHFLCKG